MLNQYGTHARLGLLLAGLTVGWLMVTHRLTVHAQEDSPSPLQSEEASNAWPDEAAAAALAEAALADETDSASSQADAPTASPPEPLNALDLFFKGGVLMYPITFMSFLVVAFSIERAIALRRRRVVPPRLMKQLRELAERPGGFDARQANHLCRNDHSTAARVVRAGLSKLGRPMSEIRQAISDTCQREATRLYKHVRPISLAITITPLIGLLGTVQGMIQAFFVTAASPVGVNKAQSLAAGIYTALVTTFAGLCVAIPAAVLAHYFEGRIQSLLGRIEDLIEELMPSIERFEPRFRSLRGEAPPPPLEPPLAVAEPVARRQKAATPE